jgi:aryl-alcohol dehydrogenase-like predicted oxidoreductase
VQSRRIGSLEVSAVGLGCNNFGGRIDETRTKEVVDAALAAGVTLFDTADIYGGTLSEEFLGRSLGERRRQVAIATKFGGRIDDEHPGGGRPEYVRAAAEDSLRRLGTDHIDLYQLHFPDSDTPLDDTIGAMAELVRQGKVRELGVSNFSSEQLREAQAAAERAGVTLASVQNQYSVLHREPEAGVLEECERAGIALLPYFPLASGLLTGKYKVGEPPPPGTRLAGRQGRAVPEDKLAKVVELERLAEEHGHSVLDLAISWLLTRSAVASVIAGATRPEQVRANTEAASFSLDDKLLLAVDEVAPGP